MKTQSGHPRELEAKLIVTDPDPQLLMDQLSVQESLAGFPLGDLKVVRIRDLYFDTPDKALGLNRLSLRIRILDSIPWLALKGKTVIHRWGGIERLEIEIPWSPAGWKEILSHLAEQGVRLPVHPAKKSALDPLRALANSGLEVLQERENVRKLRAIHHPAQRSKILAELALDTVHFHYGHQLILHFEIELESKQSEGISAVKKILQHLKRQHAGSVRPGFYSKLSLGLSLQKMSAQGMIEKFLGPQNQLLNSGYDWLESQMSDNAE